MNKRIYDISVFVYAAAARSHRNIMIIIVSRRIYIIYTYIIKAYMYIARHLTFGEVGTNCVFKA